MFRFGSVVSSEPECASLPVKTNVGTLSRLRLMALRISPIPVASLVVNVLDYPASELNTHIAWAGIRGLEIGSLVRYLRHRCYLMHHIYLSRCDYASKQERLDLPSSEIFRFWSVNDVFWKTVWL